MFNIFKRRKWRSPNFNDRDLPPGTPPSMIILHYTGMQNGRAALERLCDPAAEVSAHYLIEENGRLHSLVDEDKRAWHAGKSYWNGITDVNSASIGIEIVNPGHEFGYLDFTAKQNAQVMHVCARLCRLYGINGHNILAHSDIAPLRKQDPGEKFPWEALAQMGAGYWPSPTEMDRDAAQDIAVEGEAAIQLLVEYGYDPDVDLPSLLTAFHRHFYPEKFQNGPGSDCADKETIARLLSLIRQKNEAMSQP